jgi:hypothetical protein
MVALFAFVIIGMVSVAGVFMASWLSVILGDHSAKVKYLLKDVLAYYREILQI